MTNDKNPLVLIVDDDEISRLLIGEALEAFGFDIEEADDGNAALDAFKRLHPDIIILDVVMEGMDGFSACAELRKLPAGRYVPILMLTGLNDVESINRAYEEGATDFVSKPVNHIILGQRMRYMLRATRAAEKLRAEEKRLTNAQRIAKLGHWEWEPETGSFCLSEQLCKMLGSEGRKRIGNLDDLFEFVHPDDKKKVAETFQKNREMGTSWSIEHRIVQHNGSVRVVYQEAESGNNENHDAIQWFGTMQDITERKKSEAEITRLAYYDGLTELPNRAFLADYIKYAIELAKRNKHLFTILSLDLDDFKRINNTWGQRVGNALLQTVAQRLTKCIRAADCLAWGNEHVSERPPQLTQSGSNTDAAEDRCATLARMGGDDFVIYMGDVHGAGKAAAIARRILTELSSPYPFHKGQVFLTASIGIAIFPADGQNVETLLAHAELAMHHAKKQGGNNFQFYKQSMNIRAHRRLILETELHKAIENKELEVYYQPKVVVADKRVSGMEALVRWHHPRKGLLPPSEFIALAEESDLIVLLGEQILHNACAQTRDWVEAGHDLHVAVNLSARQFRKKDLPRVIRDVLEETGLPPERLELEITEGLLMEDSETARTILFELKEMAVRIALDDFGTGYSSLSYLKRFPLDVLKIDRSFIQDVCVNRDTSSITSAIIALSKCLQLKNVAEGVETEAQLQFLREHKCDETQGYLFSPPLPAAKFIEWLHAAAGETCS